MHGAEYNSGSADEAPEHSSHFGACLRGEAGASRLTLHIPDPRDVSVLSPSNCITAPCAATSAKEFHIVATAPGTDVGEANAPRPAA